MKSKLVLNDKNYDENLLTFSAMNENEREMLGRDDLGRELNAPFANHHKTSKEDDDLGRDSFRTNLLCG